MRPFQVNYNDTNDGREDGNWQGENPSDYNSDFSVPSDDQDSDADLDDCEWPKELWARLEPSWTG